MVAALVTVVLIIVIMLVPGALVGLGTAPRSAAIVTMVRTVVGPRTAPRSTAVMIMVRTVFGRRRRSCFGTVRADRFPILARRKAVCLERKAVRALW